MLDELITSNLILFSIIAIPIFYSIASFIIRYKEYKNSGYFKSTQNSYWQVFGDAGKKGEYFLYQWLQPFECLNYKFLFNLYIPRENNKTSEIDMVIIHPKGLLVVESKNYSGWIFGNENNKQWTQVLPAGKGRSHKEYFYNPIMQNAAHIRAIRKYINDTIPIYSIIAFSDDCTLKDVTVKNNKVIVDYYSCIYKEIKNRLAEITDYSMSSELMEETYNVLMQYANVDEIIKKQHIYNID